MSIIQSARPKTPTEQICYDTGYQQGKADAVVHGRWAVDEFGHYCTACREYGKEMDGTAESIEHLPYGSSFCPSCGARMDGGEDDG